MTIINPKIPMQASILLGANKSLKTIKTEILLTFIAELFDDYEKLRSNSCEKQGVISIDTSSEDDLIIHNAIEDLRRYFKEDVIRKEQLLKIFGNAYASQNNLVLAKQCEPLGVYYEKLATLLKHYIPIGGLFIPEYFGLLLMNYYKESGNSFVSFSYVDEFNISHLLEIYSKINIDLKKEMIKSGTHKRIWECRTTIDEMEKVAFKMIEQYNLFQYKVNIMRVSKTRRKKK